ncbi:TPA: glycosyltransferase [Raoultella ornithinolytica]|nr:glycosyltransferase [Raoultella ornithinolytica]
MCKVSVIIPVYNIEKFLPECIESLIKQNLESSEFIFINDGSTDSSGKILEQYIKKDKRIRVLNKPNGGVVTVRPLGIKEAKGEFIFFLDGDDSILPDTLHKLYDIASSNHCDIVSGSHFAERDAIEEWHFRWGDKLYTSNLDFLTDSIKYNNFYIWGKLFNAKIFTSEFYYGDSNYGEDGVFLLQLINRANRIYATSDIVYRYRLRENSLTSAPTVQSYLGRYQSSKFIYDYVSTNYQDQRVNSIAEYYFLCQVYKTILDCGNAFAAQSPQSVISLEMVERHKKELKDRYALAYVILKIYTFNTKLSIGLVQLSKKLKKIIRLIKK